MICINSKEFRFDKKTVVTIGKFDGIHIGHRKLIDRALKISKEEAMEVVAFTFKVSEGRTYPYMDSRQITLFYEREKLFEEMGVDYLIEYPFDDDVANMEPEEFLSKIVKEQLNAGYVVVGCDWTYGKMGKGDTALLRQIEKLHDYKAEIIEKELYNATEVSSSWIREEIKKGNMETADILLGHPFFFLGKVVKGNMLGRTLGVPTANVEPDNKKILPPYGVYAANVFIDGIRYYGVCNIGTKPTVTDEIKVGLETHILDFNQDIYGKEIEIRLMHFQRPEMKFQSVDTLKNQLARDIEYTKSYFMM